MHCKITTQLFSCLLWKGKTIFPPLPLALLMSPSRVEECLELNFKYVNISLPILQFLCLMDLCTCKKSAMFCSVWVSISSASNSFVSALRILAHAENKWKWKGRQSQNIWRIVAQWQSTGSSSQRCTEFDTRRLPAFSLSSIFAS